MRLDYRHKVGNHFWGVTSTLPSPRFLHFFSEKKIIHENSFLRLFPDNSHCSRPFTFTGKERDAETGYSYFGARYYDSDLSGLFMSVDPMADKYPDISPYAYCVLNPLTLIDPDGNWPWEPKHIRQARKFARQNNGCISIERRRNGVKIANVGYRSSSSEFGDVFTLRSFAPENYNSKGSIKKTSGIALAELWMDEPGETFWDDLKKNIGATLYSFINEPCEVLTGHTLAGNYINYDEKALSTIDVLSMGLGKYIQKGAQIIKTSGLTGLEKYNDFVKKSGGRHGRTQKEMGVMYQNNKRALEDYSNGKMTYNVTTLGLSTINNSNNE